MKRKLVKQAGQAITITLPIEWIRKNNLKPGDEIDIEPSEKDLIIRSDKKIVSGSIKLSTVGFSESMKYTYINSAYARGIDEIELESEKEDYPYLNQNIGFAIISQRGDKFIIKDISGTSSGDLDEVFKRVYQMIMGFYDTAIIDVFGERKENYETVRKIDEEINKFTLFLQRSIMKSSHPDASVGKIMFAYSFALEKIGDEILRLWRTDIQNKVKKEKKIKDIVQLSKQGLQKSFEIYYRSDPEKINELREMRESIRNKSLKLSNLNPDTAKFVMHAVKILEDSYDLTHLSLMKKLKPQ